jgi:hypothetical protein
MFRWLHFLERLTRRKAETFPASPLQFPNLTDDILRVVIAVCITLLSVLVADQWLMGGTITESVF